MTYYQTLINAVAEAGIHRPALVVDTHRLQSNLARIRESLPSAYSVRIADKSLSSLWLIKQAFDGLQTASIMSFHLPVTRRILGAFPGVQVLMGKPMPVAELARFLEEEPGADQVTWLVDCAATVSDYRDLAEQTGKILNVAFEVDVGLGRGGFPTPGALGAALALLGSLRPVGLMGYDAHVNALPLILGRGARAAGACAERLRGFLRVLPREARQIINTGGSTTVLGLPRGGPANDVTVGSLIVKPADFDQPLNTAIEPAIFITTPVLKTLPHSLPGHPRWSGYLRRLRIIGDRIAFIYGGKWMANPVYPAGLSLSPLFGQSSNQQGFVLPRGIEEPEFAVFRPTQSEAVIQQFPKIWTFDGVQITGSEDPLPVL